MPVLGSSLTTSCDAQLTATWGSGWKAGDYCSGGSCGAFMKCMNDCHAAASCEDGCQPMVDAACTSAFNDANSCSETQCHPQCNP